MSASSNYQNEMDVWNLVTGSTLIFFVSIKTGITVRYNIINCFPNHTWVVEVFSWIICISFYIIFYLFIIIPIYNIFIPYVSNLAPIAQNLIKFTYLAVTLELCYIIVTRTIIYITHKIQN